jgi:hypothetical protein
MADDDKDTKDDDEDFDDEDDDKDNPDDEITRINFSVPKRMKEQWQDTAKNMATSISQLIRNAVQVYTKDLERELSKASNELHQAGIDIGKEFEIDAPWQHADTAAASSTRPASSRKNTGDGNVQGDPLDQLKKLKELLDMNAITEAEFNEKKAKLLGLI